jgi:protein SCO1/2
MNELPSMSCRRLFLVSSLLAGFLTSVPAWCDQRYQGTGLVLSVDNEHQTITISHDSIPGFMDAMVMPFRVRESKALDNLRPAMMVNFTLVVTKTSSYVSDLQVREFKSVERDPQQAGRLKALDAAMQAKSGVPPVLESGQLVPDFTLTDQNDRPTTLSEFEGKVVAITFIYTRCPLPDYCLRLTNNFGRLQQRFRDRLGRDLILLSISFDPEHDQPPVLAKYASNWKADAKGWRFLTGQMTSVKQICGMFGMNFWPDEGLLTHSLHTVVIDPQRKLVANLEGNRFTAVQLGDLVDATMAQSVHKAAAK